MTDAQGEERVLNGLDIT